jgi:propionyl-CoA synthetase
VSHEIKGQVPLAFVVVKDASVLQDSLRRQGLYKEVLEAVNKSLGPVGRPEQIHFVSMLPKTRSGKILRRSIKALAQGEDPGDLTTLEDMLAIEEIRRAVTKP